MMYLFLLLILKQFKIGLARKIKATTPQLSFGFNARKEIDVLWWMCTFLHARFVVVSRPPVGSEMKAVSFGGEPDSAGGD